MFLPSNTSRLNPHNAPLRERKPGFTLIELSIVLVIIGLIVGGVLVGRDLIKAAEARATVTQIERYNSAVNTFRNKYNALPGDLNQQTASQFGFTSRPNSVGEGDGNGVIEGVAHPFGQGGETTMFWVDLTTANGLNVNLIDGSFSAATPTADAPSTAAASLYLPAAKLGNGNYIYVYSGGYAGHNGDGQGDGVNYFGLSAFVSFGQGGCSPCLWSNPGLTVAQAAAIDKKMDDGLPTTGNVVAAYLWSNNYSWGNVGTPNAGPPTIAITGYSGSCFDNGGNSSNPMQYSVEVSNGSNVTCGLSFRFQ